MGSITIIQNIILDSHSAWVLIQNYKIIDQFYVRVNKGMPARFFIIHINLNFSTISLKVIKIHFLRDIYI